MKNAILHFLESTAEKTEFELFLKLYKETPKEKFAVIKISGKSIEDYIDTIAKSIAFLNKLGVFPIIIHGAGASLDKKLPNSKKINGLRATSKKDLEIVKEVCEGISSELEEKINAEGGSAVKTSGIFKCEAIKGLGQVGKIKKVNLEPIKKAINQGKSPIVSPIGSNGNEEFNVNADSAAKELVKWIEPKKFYLLTETGGILDSEGKILHFVNLSSADALENISGGMLLKLKEIKEFLSEGVECDVVILSPENLLKEIFTVKGKGTLVKHHEIKSCKEINLEEKKEIKKLLESAFGKKLKEDFFKEEIEEVFFQKKFEGAAIIKKINGIYYLDKFAVAKPFQGTGLGKSLWEEITKKYEKLAWRAFQGNGINKFYKERCDGFMKKGKWNVYWKNLGEEEILSVAKQVAEKEESFKAIE